MLNITEPKQNTPNVKPEIEAKIFKMLTNGRRYFGSSGASLTHHANNPDYTSDFKRKLVQKGLEGERGTSKKLQEWLKTHPNAVLIDSAHIKGMGQSWIDPETGETDGGDTDHVLVLGNEVIIIDTKRWKTKQRYSFNDKGEILRQEKHFAAGRVNTKQAIFLWRKYLISAAKVSGIVCINTPKVFVKMDTNWKKQSYKLLPIEKLLSNLDYKYERMKKENQTLINTSLISQIVVCCIKPFDAYDRVFGENLKDFK